MSTRISAPPGEHLAQRKARNRAWGALEALEESRRAFEEFPSYLTAGQLRWAETELDDAIALAGEFQVPGVPWSLG